VEEHTPHTPSTECPATPPPPNYECETEHATSPESYMTPDQTEVVHTGIPERVSTKELEIPPQARVQNRPGANLEVGGANQFEATQHLEVPERSRVNTEGSTFEATQHPEAPDRNRANTEASTSELRPNKFEAAPNAEAAPFVGPNSSSRFTAAFEVLGRGHQKPNPRRVPGKCRDCFPGENCPRHSYLPLSGELLKMNPCLNQI
jgi:hypothetical protein